MQVYIPSWQNVFLSFIRPQRFISFMRPLCFITFSSWQLKKNVLNKPLRSSLRINWFVEVSRIGKKYHFLKNRSVWLDIDTLKLKKNILNHFYLSNYLCVLLFSAQGRKRRGLHRSVNLTWSLRWSSCTKKKVTITLATAPWGVTKGAA